MFKKKYLPIGDADISKVIRSGFYVDKTAYAYELLQGSAHDEPISSGRYASRLEIRPTGPVVKRIDRIHQ